MRSLIIIATLCATAWAQSCPPDTEDSQDLAYFPDSSQCDKYVQCKDGVATEELCPNGLLFNDQLQNAAYPCGYPNEVDCGSRTRTLPLPYIASQVPCDWPTEVNCTGRTKLQEPQPTENCGNAWGYFGSGDSSQCGYYYQCVDQREFLMVCPAGLAWNSQIYTCDYPDKSPDCDSAAYLGFQCPAVRDAEQVALYGHPRLASPRDCRQFFICVDQSPRLNSCEEGKVFNAEINGCDEPENVGGCQSYYPADQLKAIRERKALAAARIAQRKAELEERRAQLAQRRAAGQL